MYVYAYNTASIFAFDSMFVFDNMFVFKLSRRDSCAPCAVHIVNNTLPSFHSISRIVPELFRQSFQHNANNKYIKSMYIYIYIHEKIYEYIYIIYIYIYTYVYVYYIANIFPFDSMLVFDNMCVFDNLFVLAR